MSQYVSDELQEACLQMGKQSPLHREVCQQDDTSQTDYQQVGLNNRVATICLTFPCGDSAILKPQTWPGVVSKPHNPPKKNRKARPS